MWHTYHFRRWTCVRKKNTIRTSPVREHTVLIVKRIDNGRIVAESGPRLLSPSEWLLDCWGRRNGRTPHQHCRPVIDVLFYVFRRFIFGRCAQVEWQRGVDILSFPRELDPVIYRTLQTPVNAFTASTHPKLSSANCRVLFKRSHIRLSSIHFVPYRFNCH